MTLKFLNTKEREKILRLLEEQFGIKNVEGRFIMIGKERIFLYNGGLSKEMMEKISKITNLERAGVYFGKMMPSGNGEKIRLSIEGTQILKEEIRKNVFELSEEMVEEWMMGRELNIKTGKRDFLIIKHGDDFLCTGKVSEEKIGNFIPKNRRLKERNG